MMWIRTHPNATRMSIVRCGWTQRNLDFIRTVNEMQIESAIPVRLDGYLCGMVRALFTKSSKNIDFL